MKILIAGDFVPRNRLAPIVERGDYEAIFGEVTEIVRSADYALVNFESPVTEQGDKPITKFGPCLRCSPKAVDAIRYAGFTCATLANNHIRDYGDSGVRRTMDRLRQQGIDFVGAGENLDAATRVLYVERKGETLAVINCCEHEFTLATDERYGANPLDPVKQFYAIQEARTRADHVVVIVHGGPEHHQLPTPRMQDTYRFFIDAGADMVVNHHQHCYSGYEIYKGKPVVYGTGNFCMDKQPLSKGQSWNEGYMVLWDTDDKRQIELIPYSQCGDQPTVHLLRRDAFDERLQQLNAVIGDRQRLEQETKKYYDTCHEIIRCELEPIQLHYVAALQHRHLLPSLVTRRWLVKLQKLVMCESHRDKLEHYFNGKMPF